MHTLTLCMILMTTWQTTVKVLIIAPKKVQNRRTFKITLGSSIHISDYNLVL